MLNVRRSRRNVDNESAYERLEKIVAVAIDPGAWRAPASTRRKAIARRQAGRALEALMREGVIAALGTKTEGEGI
jgi:hypothetical protein